MAGAKSAVFDCLVICVTYLEARADIDIDQLKNRSRVTVLTLILLLSNFSWHRMMADSVPMCCLDNS